MLNLKKEIMKIQETGYSLEEIQATVGEMIKESKEKTSVNYTLDELLENATEDKKHEEVFSDRQGRELL